jgi:hypothetical protein
MTGFVSRKPSAGYYCLKVTDNSLWNLTPYEICRWFAECIRVSGAKELEGCHSGLDVQLHTSFHKSYSYCT